MEEMKKGMNRKGRKRGEGSKRKEGEGQKGSGGKEGRNE